MRFRRLAPLVAGLVFVVAGPAHAQSTRPALASTPSRFESWRAEPLPDAGRRPTAARLGVSEPNRKRQALLGGAIGAAAGVIFCTAVSTLTNDSAEGGLSFCPLDSYLLFGGGGFVVGAAIGWII